MTATIASVDFVNGSPLVLVSVREYVQGAPGMETAEASSIDASGSGGPGLKLVVFGLIKSSSLPILYVSKSFREPAYLCYSTLAASLLLMTPQARGTAIDAFPLNRLVGHLLYPVLAVPIQLPLPLYIEGLASKKDLLPVTCIYISTSVSIGWMMNKTMV